LTGLFAKSRSRRGFPAPRAAFEGYVAVICRFDDKALDTGTSEFCFGATVMRAAIALTLTAAITGFAIQAAAAQTPDKKPTSPGEIAAVSRALAERSATCRSEAKAKKLHFGKRRAFLRECMKQ
jgi:hypothetical protein